MVEQGDDCNTLVLQGVGPFLVKPDLGLRFGVWQDILARSTHISISTIHGWNLLS